MRLLIFASMLLSLGGCPNSQIDPISQRVADVTEKVVYPALQKALTETQTNSLALQGSLQGINPGYVVDGEGYWVVGVKFRAGVHVDGVSGQLSGATQATGGEQHATSQP